jgi:hypothetical protein
MRRGLGVETSKRASTALETSGHTNLSQREEDTPLGSKMFKVGIAHGYPLSDQELVAPTVRLLKACSSL